MIQGERFLCACQFVFCCVKLQSHLLVIGAAGVRGFESQSRQLIERGVFMRRPRGDDLFGAILLFLQ